MSVPKPGEVWELEGMLTVLVLRPRPDLDKRYGAAGVYFDVLQLRAAYDVGIDEGTEDWVAIGQGYDEGDRWERIA